MKYVILLILSLSSSLCLSQNRLEKELELFKSENYSDVHSAKKYLLQLHDKEVISGLVEMLKDSSYVELQGTADLIYPGAKKFYGHGGVVRYDIDWISARAGWLLEEITFQNFGFLKKEISYDELSAISSEKLTLKKNDHRERIIIYRQIMADKFSEWWNKNKNEWTDYDALIEALESYNVYRWDLAIQYLRFGDYLISNLNPENYDVKIKPILRRIKQNNHTSASYQAKYLLEDDENYWYKNKVEKSKK